MNPQEAEFYPHIIAWAQANPLVRAMLITSTRAVPNTTPDILSDYDIVLALQDIHPFHADRDWLSAFGTVLALFRDPIEMVDGFLQSGYVIQFVGGLKIDFSLWECAMLRQVAAAEQLPDEFDAGYRILLDKDGLTEGMKPPTYQAYIPRRPAESKYIEMIENFFLETGYTAKYLWRDDPMAAKFILDTCMKLEHLLPMLEWHVECAHNWSLKTGPHGRGMKKWLRPDLWAQLEATYSGAGLEENWETLDRMIVLMRTVALEVGQCLGYVYPEEIEQRARVYIEQVKNMPRDTQPGPGLNTWK